MVLPGGAYFSHGDLGSTREEALEVIVEARQWRLTEARWQSIDLSLIAMDAALKAGDPAALAAATADVEIAGPVRITKIGDPQVELPPPVRDRMNRLVHSLGAVQAPQRPQGKDATSDAGS
jgi:hypothetical protein